jgi:DNA polymerase-3 subunit beta
LLEIVSSLPNSVTVQVAVNDRRARLTAGRSKFDVVGMSLEEYPNISVESIKGWVTAAAPAFCDALSRIGKQAASEMSRPQFSSVLLEVLEDGTYLVGSDGTGRIARLAIDVGQGKPNLSGKFMIPRAAVTAVTKLFAASEQLTISGTKQQMRISDSAGTSMIIRLTEGEYAAYAHILGLQRSAFVVLSRNDLLGAVKRVSTVTDRGRVELTFGSSELTLTAKSEDQGTAEDVIGCAFVAGNWERTRPTADGTPKTEAGRIEAPFEMGCNPDLLNDACDVIRAEQLRIDFSFALGPVYVRDAATPDAQTVVGVMPLRAEGSGSSGSSSGGSK